VNEQPLTVCVTGTPTNVEHFCAPSTWAVTIVAMIAGVPVPQDLPVTWTW
jgi:hypothetical protein